MVITKSYQRIGGKDIITLPKTDKSIRRVLLPDFLSEESQQYLSGLEDAANDKGYGISNEGAEVVIESGTLVKDANEKAGAVIYVQKSPEEKEAGTWTELKNFEDISTDHTVDFDGQVVGVKVVYTNTLEYFTSGEIVLNVTFANRSETSTENDHEVRRIINQADISWADTYKDRDGNEQERNYNLSSNEVMAEIPTYEAQLPGTNTGDNTAVMPYIILGAVGAGGCIAPGIAYRRKRKVF